MTSESPNAALLRHAVRSFVDWLFRLRTPGMLLIRSGLILFGLLLVGWALKIVYPTDAGTIHFSLATDAVIPEWLTYVAFGFAAMMVTAGSIWEIHRYRTETARSRKKRIVAVELRGLRDSPGLPITTAIPPEFTGIRDQVLIDLRDHIVDGRLSNPQVAAEQINLLPRLLRTKVDGLDRDDLSYVFGGLAPVPLTFLAGLLMDDEQAVAIVDWDRNAGKWKSLAGPDDGKRFSTICSDAPLTGEVALAISVSYTVDTAGVSDTLGEIPVVHMILESGAPDCHWSEEKQQAMGNDVLTKLIELSNSGVTKIHLFLAAQSSLVFRFGRLYDKRNLPPVRVYQYQRGDVPVFPWAIEMPVAGKNTAEVVFS